MIEHDQLQVHVADKVNTVDSVHVFCQVLQKPQVKVMQDMDGIEIEMPALAASAVLTSSLWRLECQHLCRSS